MKIKTLSFVIPFAVFLAIFSFSFVEKAGAQNSLIPCQPNKALYPNGKDPNCINGFYRPDYINTNAIGFYAPAPGIVNVGGFNLISCNFRQTPKNFKELVLNIFVGCILSPLVPVIFGIALIVFLWGVFKFIMAEGDDKQAGRQLIFWGIVGLFAMVSLYGLVSILRSTFNLNMNADITPRSVNLGL